jgi:opacity protein-like surface antigen
MRFIFATVAAAALFASPAFAADDGGFYVGAGLGSASIDIDLIEGVDFSGDDTAFKVFGGYGFNQYIAVELEYIDGGTAEDSYSDGVDTLKIGIDLSGFNANVVGAWPIGEQFKIFGKIGMLFWDADFNAKLNGVLIPDGEDSDSGEDFSWGVGASWDFTDNIGAQIEYQGFEIEDVDTADLISASVYWRF